MSVTSSIICKTIASFKALDIIDSLIYNGWNINDYGQITYLKTDDFDWERLELGDFETIRQDISLKSEKGDLIGIALLNETLHSGGTFHFFESKCEIMILLSINRITIQGANTTDFSIYLKRLIDDVGCEFISIICEDNY